MAVYGPQKSKPDVCVVFAALFVLSASKPLRHRDLHLWSHLASSAQPFGGKLFSRDDLI